MCNVCIASSPDWLWRSERNFSGDLTGKHIVRIFKKQNKSADRNNWRGVTLLSILSEVICKVVMIRVVVFVDTAINSQEQAAGFRRWRRAHTDSLRSILE